MKQIDKLPAITLPSTNNRDVNLSLEARSNNLILFFFPGYGTGKRYPNLAGCTLEGKMFRDNHQIIDKLGSKVFGISLQTTEEQKRFVSNERLNFELLSDADRKLTDALGVPVWTSPAGDQFTLRTTFIIKKGGRIAKVMENVISDRHVEEVVKSLKEI